MAKIYGNRSSDKLKLFEKFPINGGCYGFILGCIWDNVSGISFVSKFYENYEQNWCHFKCKPAFVIQSSRKTLRIIYLPNTVSLASIELITTICLCPLGKTEPIWQGKWDSQSDIVTNVLPQLPWVAAWARWAWGAPLLPWSPLHHHHQRHGLYIRPSIWILNTKLIFYSGAKFGPNQILPQRGKNNLCGWQITKWCHFFFFFVKTSLINWVNLMMHMKEYASDRS